MIELAIAIGVITLLLGSILVPLQTQIETRNYSATEKTLADIQNALVGFAAINGRFPRPATSSNDGTERAACATEAQCRGFIPWTTLGVSKLDAYGKIIGYSVTMSYANSTFTLTSTGNRAIQTRDSAGALVNIAINIPVVLWSHGKDNWGTTDSGTAIGDNSVPNTNTDEDTNANAASTTFVSRRPTPNTGAAGGEFDDVVSWLSMSAIAQRMVSAGKLP